MPLPPKHILSKSTFMIGCQCPKRMWFHKFQPDLADEGDDTQAAIFQTDKWNGAKRYSKSQGSFFSAGQNTTVHTSVIVLFWDELLSLIPDTKVKTYLINQLERTK